MRPRSTDDTANQANSGPAKTLSSTQAPQPLPECRLSVASEGKVSRVILSVSIKGHDNITTGVVETSHQCSSLPIIRPKNYQFAKKIVPTILAHYFSRPVRTPVIDQNEIALQVKIQKGIFQLIQ